MVRIRNQAGFGPVGIILILAVFLITGFVGFLVLKNHSKFSTTSATTVAPTETAATSSQTTAPPNGQPATQILVIKEWGIKLNLNNNTSSLYYYIDPNLPNVAYLSLKAISDIAPNCAADKTSLGAISRLTSVEHQSAIADPTRGQAGSVQIGEYWYGYTAPQAACMNSTEEAAVQQALPGYNPNVVANVFESIAANN